MLNLALIAICLTIGLLMQRLKTLPHDAHLVLNLVILYVCLPALTFLVIPKLEWDLSLLSLCLVPWIIFGLSYLVFTQLGKRLGWGEKTIGCLILTAGLGNTSFVGLPVIEALLGEGALKYALLLDQAGTFLICSTFGIWICARYSSASLSSTELLKKVLFFPPFLSFSLALVLSLLGFKFSVGQETLLGKLASMLAPLALISVGLQLKIREIKASLVHLKWGLFFKLILAPMIIFFLYSLMNVPPEIFKVALLESAMAPMITASILAATHGLEPRLAGLMVGVGVPLSFLSLAAWYIVL